MIDLIKLTDARDCTKNHTRWGVNVTHTAKGRPELFSAGVIHAYRDLSLALLMSPMHRWGNFKNIWAARSPSIEVEDHFMCGVYKLTTVEKIAIPKWYADKERRKKVQIKFGQLCIASVADAEITVCSATEAKYAASAANAAAYSKERINFIALAQQAVIDGLREN